jgi:hypothetical protein
MRFISVNFQSPNANDQIISNHQTSITKRFELFGILVIEFLVIIWLLACLREAASAKAGA